MKSDFSPSRRTWNVIMTALVWAAAVLVIALTVGVIGLVLVRGIPNISWEFLSTTASVLKGTDGILPAILNTLYVILLTLLIVLPLGVGAAVYLTEYASNRKLIEVIEFTNETLAGIPSIIYGLVGMLVFAQTMGFKTCLLSGSLTLVVMNLPTIIRTTQESLKTVPQGYREGALGLGAGKWHIIRTSCCPAASTASSPAASWPWAVSWVRARPCSSPPARRKSLRAASPRPTHPTVRPSPSCSICGPSRTATSPPPGASAQCCWSWCFSSTSQPVWQKQSSNRNSKGYFMDNNMPVISAKNLNLWYGDFKALKGISLDVGEREITALIGPSGCGKSTFLKTLNRMNDLVPNVRIEGDVRLRGEDIFSKEMQLTDLRRRVGMVFQKANPFPMSIYDNITYGPKLHGVRNKAELDELVESSLRGAALWDEVKDRLKKSALGLSGGQQQRLCIARALAVKPEVLLMDEPTSALDPGSTMKVEELMSELKKNYTVVIVTHNMQQAARISDRTAFFLLGELVECGPTGEIFSTPKDKRTEDYISGRFG